MGSAAGGFQPLIDAHYESLYRYAYRLCGSVADAEDLTQEAIGKAFARLPQLREPDRAQAWLYRILRNLYLHKVRDDKRHRVVPLDAVGDLPGREIEDGVEVDPGKLQQALDGLDESFRTPLILFYFEEFSYRAIAEHMDLPIGTVMSRLARARAYLRTQLCPKNAEDDHSSQNSQKDPQPDQTDSPVTRKQETGPRSASDVVS
jgi:RNA polymerase sigma-70 factor (ECF subfamily)